MIVDGWIDGRRVRVDRPVVRVNHGSYRLLGDDRVESVVRVRGVVHGALGAVRVDKAVRAVHHVPVTALPLALRVASQLIVHAVRVRVRRVRVVFRVRVVWLLFVLDVQGGCVTV